MTERVAKPELIRTERGPVEVIRRGGGPPALFVHGTPGGCDASLAMGRFLVDAGFELIAPSRPGYLGTPLESGVSFDDEAELLAALLEALGHERAGVACWSGGGPSSYRLAVRHPERVSTLVAFAAISKAYRPDLGWSDRMAMETGLGNWLTRLMVRRVPKSMVSATLKAEGDLTRQEVKERTAVVMADERKLEIVKELALVIGDYPRRRNGVKNDRERFAAIESLELERVRAPTLVIHGEVDTDVAPDHGEHAAAAIPGAEQLVMDRGTHLCLFTHPDAEAAQGRVVEFLGSS